MAKSSSMRQNIVDAEFGNRRLDWPVLDDVAEYVVERHLAEFDEPPDDSCEHRFACAVHGEQAVRGDWLTQPVGSACAIDDYLAVLYHADLIASPPDDSVGLGLERSQYGGGVCSIHRVSSCNRANASEVKCRTRRAAAMFSRRCVPR